MTVTFGGKVFKILDVPQAVQKKLAPFVCDKPCDVTFDLQKELKDKSYTTEREIFYFIHGLVTKYLLESGVCRVHCSAIEYKGVAYAFGAPSGTGKSTHTKMWKDLVGAEYINDDQPFFTFENGVTVYPSPWSGKHGRFSTKIAPLGAFVIIKRSNQNKIYPIDKKTATVYLYKQVLQPEEDYLREKILEYMQNIVQNVPFYILECDKSVQAFKTCFNALTGEEYEN